jgi:putative serine protease PepD
MRAVRPGLHRAVALAALAALAGCGSSGHPATSAAVTATPAAVTTAGAAPATAEPAAQQLQDQFRRVVRAVSPSVVQIRTDAGLGSGIVFDGKGDIVTNAHVVTGARTLSVTLERGDHHPATLVGIYAQNDLAVIRVSGVRPRPAAFADSSKVQVGDLAMAVGNPLGLRSSVTQGIVSSAGRTVSEGNGVVLPSAIQTSAEINPGNSGGALVDLDGAVIGIPTLAATDPEFGGAQAPGIGFAIPSNTAKNFAAKLIATGSVAPAGRAFLGLTASTIVGGGVVVESVERGGPAATAGIKPGDVIVAVAGQPTPTTDVLSSVLATVHPGQKVPVVVVDPQGARSTIQVRLGSQPGR